MQRSWCWGVRLTHRLSGTHMTGINYVLTTNGHYSGSFTIITISLSPRDKPARSLLSLAPFCR